MSRDKRKYPRIAIEAGIRFRPVHAEKSTMEYLEGVLENLGLGGVFIATNDPLPKGSLVDLEFRILELGQEYLVRAQAIVRWDRRLFTPRGMGLEFVSFQGLGRDRVETWLRRIRDDSFGS